MGIGPVWTFSRRHIFTAFLPWLTLGFLLYRDRYLHTALLFGVCGLVANLHASGLLLIQILSLTWLLGAPISPMRACKAMLLLIIGHLTAFYALGSIWGRALENISALLLGGMLTSSYAETLFPVLETAKSAMPAALQYLSYPPREYDHWPRIIIDAWFAATILAGLLILPTKRWLPEHFPHILFLATILSLLFVSANEFGTLVLIGSLLYFSRVPHSDNNAKLHTVSLLIVVTYWISVVGGIAFQVAHVSIQGFPLVWDQFRGMRFLGFFVFLWLGVLWSTPSRSILPRWYKSALALALLVFIFGQIKTFERQHVRYSNSEEFAKRAALLEIAQWARNHTPSDSLFLVGSSGFGITANRRVTHSDKSIQGPDAPPLAPKHSPSSTEALKYAHSLHATHAVLGASKDKNTENPCTLVANHQFQLAEIRCLEQQPTLQK